MHKKKGPEVRLGKRSRSKKFIKESPFLIVSFFFHLVVLLLLAFITAQEPREERQRIEVQVEEMPEEDMEMEPLITEETLSTDAEAAGGPGTEGAGEGAGEGFEDAAGDVEGLDAPSVDVLGMSQAVGEGAAGQFEGRSGEGFEVTSGEGEGVEGAVDQFAVATINAASQGKTLVVLNIDRTRSVIYLNLPRLIERMDNYFESIDRNLTSEMVDNVEWIVVGYGGDVVFHTSPSQDLEHIKSALRDVDVCPTGEQNLGAALNTILDRYGDYGHREMLVATMTDGYGSDLRDASLLERSIQRLNDNRASLYVFGHEAAFASNRKRKSLELDPDLLQPEDRSAVRGFEGRTIRDWVDAGPEAPRRELWSGNRHWGWDDRHMPPSGFGMYAMNRMVLATGGIYFLLEDESDYDDDKMYAQYNPDICSIPEYENRMEEEPLRAALEEVWAELPDLYITRRMRVVSFTEDGPREAGGLEERVRSALNDATEGRRFASDRIEKLQSLLDRSEVRSMQHFERWRAHAQITIAELKRMRFMLGQYAEILDREWQRHGDKYVFPDIFEVIKNHHERYARDYRVLELLEEGQDRDAVISALEGYRYELSVTSGSPPGDFVGEEAARDEYDVALQYAKRVKEEHSDTPWEILAERIKSNLYPWRCLVRERRPRETRPEPPDLAL